MTTVADPTGQDNHRRWTSALDGFVFHGDPRSERKWIRLRTHPLLARCPLVAVRRVAAMADEVSFVAGDVLVEQGRSPEWFFLIDRGEAEVVRDGRRLGVLRAGDHFGEVALLGRGSHPATVRACTPMTAFVIGSQRFLPLVEDISSLRADMAASLARQADMVVLSRAERARHFHPRPSPGDPQLSRHGYALKQRGYVPRTRRRRPPALPPSLLPTPLSTRRRRAAWVAVSTAVLAFLALAAANYHPPLAVVSPGPVIDVSRDITISGVPVHPPSGRYLLLAVRIERPSLLGIGRAVLHQSGQVVHVEAASNSVAQRRRRLVAEFTHSQTDAVLAVADALDLVKGNAPLPFTVRFRHRDIVGPSAGLVYALAIHDLLSPTDSTQGRTIAATGEVDSAGNVVSVGYVGEKVVAARRAGAQLLIVPRSQADDAAGRGIAVDGVRSLQEALADLSHQ